jgi:hypothetical protein
LISKSARVLAASLSSGFGRISGKRFTGLLMEGTWRVSFLGMRMSEATPRRGGSC